MCQRKELHSGRWSGGGREDGIQVSSGQIYPFQDRRKKIKARHGWAESKSKDESRGSQKYSVTPPQKRKRNASFEPKSAFRGVTLRCMVTPQQQTHLFSRSWHDVICCSPVYNIAATWLGVLSKPLRKPVMRSRLAWLVLSWTPIKSWLDDTEQD